MRDFNSRILSTTDESKVPIPELATEHGTQLYAVSDQTESQYRYAVSDFSFGDSNYRIEPLSCQLPIIIYLSVAYSDRPLFVAYFRRREMWRCYDDLATLQTELLNEIMSDFSCEARSLIQQLQSTIEGSNQSLSIDQATEMVTDCVESASTFYSGDATKHLDVWRLVCVSIVARIATNTTSDDKPRFRTNIRPARPRQFETPPPTEFSIGDIKHTRQVKHWCDHCKTTIWIDRIQLSRAAAPKCKRCGTVLIQDHEGAERTDEILGQSNVRRVRRR